MSELFQLNMKVAFGVPLSHIGAFERFEETFPIRHPKTGEPTDDKGIHMGWNFKPAGGASFSNTELNTNASDQQRHHDPYDWDWDDSPDLALLEFLWKKAEISFPLTEEEAQVIVTERARHRRWIHKIDQGASSEEYCRNEDNLFFGAAVLRHIINDDFLPAAHDRDSIPGKYRFTDGIWDFEEARLAITETMQARVQHALEILFPDAWERPVPKFYLITRMHHAS